MQVYPQLELVSVQDSPEKVTMIFLDDEHGEIHNIIWRKQKFNSQTQEYEEDESKLDQVKGWAEQYFGLPLENLYDAIGTKMDVYAYDTFDSLWESDKKFDPKTDVNQVFNTTIKSIDLKEDGITIHYEWKGDTYGSNMKFTEQFNGKFYPNPQKRARQLRKFEEKFHTSIDNKDDLIGDSIMVTVRKVGKYAYGDITYLESMA